MENTAIVVFSCVIAAVFVVSVLSTLIVLARVKGVEERLDATVREMLQKSQPKQLESANAAALGAQAIVQTTVQEIAKFKDQIHSEMQRFYAIMSRKEAAAKKLDGIALPSADASTTPDEVDASSFSSEPENGEEISKADLRKLARKAGL